MPSWDGSEGMVTKLEFQKIFEVNASAFAKVTVGEKVMAFPHARHKSLDEEILHILRASYVVDFFAGYGRSAVFLCDIAGERTSRCFRR
jgi:hypothetical protein